jgi:hypothetical protein
MAIHGALSMVPLVFQFKCMKNAFSGFSQKTYGTKLGKSPFYIAPPSADRGQDYP